jgi:cell fate regulator YaaT (PSP1 superfamily)
MAGPMFDRKLNQSMTDGLKEMGLTEIEKIDDYFNNTESRQRAFKEAGKNLLAVQELESPLPDSPVDSIVYHWPLYVVEFKAGRTDYFYLAEESKNLKISVGDLAIVEADRGKDLGKVIETNIASLAELQLYQATHIDPLVDSHNAIGKEIQPKKIYKLAAANEVAMLISKNQDESKANELCQTKIRAKKLPMEIVDAEYQWDRRKLTFYFVADRRIDFRELVRELFKLYKTRIWMCAVNPSS